MPKHQSKQEPKGAECSHHSDVAIKEAFECAEMFCKTDDVCSTRRDTCVPCDDDKDQLALRYIGSC